MVESYRELLVEPENILFIADLDLVRKAQHGEKSAFTQIYSEHLGHIYGVCMRMLANVDDAKEVTQRTIIQAWTMLGSYRGESPLSAWLHQIAVRSALDHLRSKKRLTARVEFTDDPDVLDGPVSRSGGESMDLARAIALLPTQARTVLVLHDIEGYNHEEIAVMMGTAVGTSKGQLHRARRLLREALK
ncbi:MAG: RNA polymerase sigma factor [Bacteroidota bacterium]